MVMVSRRRFLEASATLAAVAPLTGASAKPAAMDATAMGAALAAGKTSGAALVAAAIDRLERANPKINAVSFKDYDRARSRAKAAPGSALAGIPTLVKELAPQKGLPWTEGARAYKDRIADHDSGIVTAIYAAGLVPIGRSTSPEFGLTATGEALLNGPTRNPWNLDHSSGGSSSGSGAAVAAGVVPFAHASDGGGSIRIPASCNGLVGLKPSRSRVQGDPGDIVYNLSVNNCVSRTVRDTAAWFAAVEQHGADARFAPVGLVAGPSDAKLRVGARLTDGYGNPPTEDVQRVFAQAQALISKLGHKLADQPQYFDGKRGNDAFLTLWGAGAARNIEAVAKSLGRMPGPADLEPLTFGMASIAQKAGPDGVKAAIGTLTEMAKAYVAQFDSIDILMTPVLGSEPVKIGYLGQSVPLEEQLQRVTRYAAFTGNENVAGCPSIALPIGMSRNGLPIGIQFATKPGGERILLELAYALESELEWHRRTPPLWVGG